MTQVIFPS